MPNSLQSSATNCILSSITEHSFQGIVSSPRGGSVTHVSGTMCYLCLRSLIGSFFSSSSVDNRVDMYAQMCIYLPVSYEWDPAKARANFEKHGIHSPMLRRRWKMTSR